jgi:hypothetical protein
MTAAAALRTHPSTPERARGLEALYRSTEADEGSSPVALTPREALLVIGGATGAVVVAVLSVIGFALLR